VKQVAQVIFEKLSVVEQMTALAKLPRELAFLHTSFIPEREFNPTANANLVVNHAEIIPNNMRIDAQHANPQRGDS
jgi:hypothetical protein